MASLFADPAQRILALYGQTGDYFYTPQLRELDLSSWLLAHFKAHGYRRILFYSPRKKLHFLDAESAQLSQPDRPRPSPAEARPAQPPPPQPLKAGPLGMARLRRRSSPQSNATPSPNPAHNGPPSPVPSNQAPRWDFGAMSDAQAISALDRLLCEALPTALILQNGEDLFNTLDADAVRHWDDTLGDWCGARLPASSRNLAVVLFRDAIRLNPDRLPRLCAHLFDGEAQRPRANRAFRIGAARQDEVTALLHRLRLRGELAWTPAQIARHSLSLAQRLIPDDPTASIKSLGTLAHEVRAMSTPPPADQAPWHQLRAAPGLAARVEAPLRSLVQDARAKLARQPQPQGSRGPLDIARLTPAQPPAADQLANLHLALLGSPGTGKTTLARLVARIYRDEGLLDSGHLIETRASQLIEEHVGGTAKRTADMIDRALGGVLFIDEAYSLASNSFGAEAVTELVQAMTQYNGQFAVIIAGYTREITDLIEGSEANPGLRRRFPKANRWTLTNYSGEELYAIFCHQLQSEGYAQEAALAAQLPAAFAQWQQAQDAERFGNAGEVKNLVADLTRTAGERRTISLHDFAALPGWRQWLGLQPLPSVEELLRPLDALIGMDPVRAQLAALCRQLHLEQRRTGRLAGQAPGHYLFTGNPGTGKTTVARIMGEMLHQLGLLNTNTPNKVHEVPAHRLIGDHVGATERLVREALRHAQDRVLFIDEAHQLAEPAGESALRVLVPEMENRRQQLCVILAGYPEPLKRLLDRDPGLASRCQEIVFPDYAPAELHRIAGRMLADKSMQLSPQAADRLMRLLAFLHAQRAADFGNARDVRNLIERDILAAQAKRLHNTLNVPNGDPRLFIIEPEDIPSRPGFDPEQWEDAVTGQGKININRILAKLEHLVGLMPVKTALRELADTLAVQQRRSAVAINPGHYVFSGNPGTGKTTVARIMGEVFRALGLLERGHLVEVKREDLVGRYQGEAETNTKARIEEALNGILFIDEAYQLNADEHDSYGRRALETLLANMENERHRLCVILAGYPQEMERLLATNPGFQRRMSRFISFPDYTAEELLEIARGQLAAQQYSLTPEADQALARHLQGWDQRRGRPDFGNAGDVRKLVETIIARQAGRLRPRIDQVSDLDLNTILVEDIPK